jgi:hypothetical protein
MTTRPLPFQPRTFGRRRPFVEGALASPAPSLSDDLQLFAFNFLAGFVFLTVYLA